MDKMPAITIVKRQYDSRADGRTLTPTAVGFLVPLLLVFLCAPFACVFFIRRRRQGRPPDYVLNLRTPAQRKEEARAKLATVTEVSSIASGGDDDLMNEKGCSAETTSILDRECAICLSTLYAPSPPEPAKTTGAPLSKAPSLSGVSLSGEKEEILRLIVCGHEYHMECLMSWFLVRKYSCPICRAVYFSTKTVQELAAEGEESRQGQSEGEGTTSGNIDTSTDTTNNNTNDRNTIRNGNTDTDTPSNSTSENHNTNNRNETRREPA